MTETDWRQNLYARFGAFAADEHVQWLYTF
jgi:hypothetical protein